MPSISVIVKTNNTYRGCYVIAPIEVICRGDGKARAASIVRSDLVGIGVGRRHVRGADAPNDLLDLLQFTSIDQIQRRFRSSAPRWNGEQITSLDLESVRDASQVVDTNVNLAALDLADVLPVVSNGFGELLLGESASLS